MLKALAILFLIIGLLMSGSGIGTFIYFKIFIKEKVHENVMLRPNSSAYESWLKPPANIYRKYYLFEIKNPTDVEKGLKPVMIERGPYTYRQKNEKKNPNFLGNKFLNFYPIVTLEFEPSLSNGSETDRILFLNAPILGAIEKGTNTNADLGLLNNLIALTQSKLFTNRTVKELIGGYEDPLLSMIKQPALFGLFAGKNGTQFENFTIETGYNCMSSLGELVSYNNLQKLGYWNTDYANFINGTDSTIFPPFRKRDQILYVFNSELCRSVRLTYLKDNKINGIKTLDFRVAKDAFNNTDNEGFCDSDCLGNGVFNISKCRSGVSAFLSKPHFLHADSKFAENIDGMEPIEEKHDSIFNFEPTAGVPVRAKINLQVNQFMMLNEKIDILKNVKSNLIPIAWFSQIVEVQQTKLADIKKLANLVNLVTIAPLVVLSIGVVLFLASILMLICVSRQKKQPIEKDLPLKNINL